MSIYIRNVYNNVAALLVCIAATCLFSACSKDDDDADKKEPELPETGLVDGRTVMVYMAADNSLSSKAIADINEVVEGFNKMPFNVANRIVIYVDDRIDKPRIYALDKKDGPANYNELVPVKTYPKSVNSVSSEMLGEFVDFVQSRYPSKSYGLVLGSHGAAWMPPYVENRPATLSSRSFGEDHSARCYGMGTDEIADVLERRGGVDFVFFDACFMQTIEVACDLMNAAKHIVASPAEVPLEGADYKVMVEPMFCKDDYAGKMCEAYNDTYLHDPQGGVVISCVNTDSLRLFVPYMRDVMEELTDSMDYVDVDEAFVYRKYRRYTNMYPDLPDMRGVMKRMLGDEEYARWNEEVEKVVRCWHGVNWWSDYRTPSAGLIDVVDDECAGISMYVSREVYNDCGAYFDYYFRKTRWAKMLWGE